MADDDYQISFKELHTSRKEFDGELYLKPLPQYPESVGEADESFEEELSLTDMWARDLQQQINNKPHHPNSYIYGLSRYNSRLHKKYDGNPNTFLTNKNKDDWMSLEDFIDEKPLNSNYWFNRGGIQNGGGALGQFRSWDADGSLSTYEIIRQMCQNKFEQRNNINSSHYVGEKGKYSRIFDLVNGYYSLSITNREAQAQINMIILNFLKKLNQEESFEGLRIINPLTGNKLSENQESIIYQFEKPKDIYHKNLMFRILEEQKILEPVEITLDIKLVIKYFMALEKISHGNINSPMSCMGAVQGYFGKEPYSSALEDLGISRKDLAGIIKSPETKELFDEVNNLSAEQLQNFVDENESTINVEVPFTMEEEWVMKTISISQLLNEITDVKAKTALVQFRPPISPKDRGGIVIEQKLERVALGKKDYIIWITNDPVAVMMSNTSQKWGIKNRTRWDGVNMKGHVSCINLNGIYSAGPFFDFYNGNGVAYIAKVKESTINEYLDNMVKGEKNKLSPEELFNKSNLVGRVSLRWGNKTNKNDENIGWGIGIEPTIYPKSQGWASGVFQGLAQMFKTIKDTSGNSIWDSSSSGSSPRERTKSAVNKIKAPYKNGWSYLDYNGTGYCSEIPAGDYDCDGLSDNNKKLEPDYNQGLKMGISGSPNAQFFDLSEGVDIDLSELVGFEIRDYQEITTLITDMNMFGAIEPSIYRNIAQNPQIWISSTSLALIIRGLFRATGQVEYQSIRKDFLELALDSTTKNISWLLQPPTYTTSIAENLDSYDTSKKWNWGTNCLLQTIYNHPSVLEVFKGHTPEISIQEHLYNQEFILKDRDGLKNIALASDIFLLNLEQDVDNQIGIVPIDNSILSKIIANIKTSSKGNLKNESKLPNSIYPRLSINWEWWRNRNSSTRLMAPTNMTADKKLLLAYHQLLAINKLAYNPFLTEKNYENLCEIMTYLDEFIKKTDIGLRQEKLLKVLYNKTYQSLSFALMYDKSKPSSLCYQNNETFITQLHPSLASIGNVLDWAITEVGSGIEAVDSQTYFLDSFRDSANFNPLTGLEMHPNTILQIRKLQNITCMNSWNKIPQDYTEFKLTMFYYLYHFMNNNRNYSHLLKIYIEFVDNFKKNLGNESDYNNLALFGFLFDTLIDEKGSLLPCNPYINNSQVASIVKKIGLQEELQSLRFNIQGNEDSLIRTEFNGAGLSEFIKYILSSNISYYGVGNLFSLLRTPRQFIMAEEAMFKLSLGENFQITRKNKIMRQIDKQTKYTFIVPQGLNYTPTQIDELLENNDFETYENIQNSLTEIRPKLISLSKYIKSLSKNPYLPETMQSRLILTTNQTNAYSIPIKVIESDTQGNYVNTYKTNVHYKDIFTLYGAKYTSDIFASSDEESLNQTIINNLVNNPIIAESTIKQLITYIDDSLLKDFILNAKLNFNEMNLENSSAINKLLFDNAPDIIKNNTAISDELRLNLFNIYLTYIFEDIDNQQIQSLEVLKNFAFNVNKFRSVENIGDLKNMLSQLNFNNINMWRGGFGKFAINSSIPENIVRVGDTINERVINTQKPQIIIDINFKPPYESVHTGSKGNFILENDINRIAELELETQSLNESINDELARLNVEEDYDYESLAQFIENMDMGIDNEEQQLADLIEKLRTVEEEMNNISSREKVNKQTAPISFKIRYIEQQEITSKGLKLSGSYWDSERTRVTNKWTEIYPNGWDSVYGYNNQDEYGFREDGTKKLWKNQITLVFYDSNPQIGWELKTDSGTELPLWRYEDSICSSAGYVDVQNAMILNMKSPQDNLAEFMAYYSDFITNSGKFYYNQYSEDIQSSSFNNSFDEYSISIEDLSNIFVTIDSMENNWWEYLAIEGDSQSIYTKDPLLFLLFIQGLGDGIYSNLSRPPLIMQTILQSLDTYENFTATLVSLGLCEEEEEDELYLQIGGAINDTELGIQLINLSVWNQNLSYNRFIDRTAPALLRNMGQKMEGVIDDINYFAQIYNATITLPNTWINNYCQEVLIARREDWIEYMREEGNENPEAVVQEAEEYQNTRNKKVNIDEEKIKEYINKILRRKNYA